MIERVVAHLEDLQLARACLEGQPGALETFRAKYGALLARELDEDGRQVLHQRLFVGPPPKLASYTGRGPLSGWLRVVARRLRLEGTRDPLADEQEVAALEAAADDPELAYLKAKYRADYQQAFAAALALLDDRERTVLAQYHADRLTIDELGALYGVHRVTASRWVAKAEERVRDEVLRRLKRGLGLATVDLRSVTRLVRSQLSLHLRPERA